MIQDHTFDAGPKEQQVGTMKKLKENPLMPAKALL